MTRILVVAEEFPWPITGGGHFRLEQTLEALSDLAELDLFTLVDPCRTVVEAPPTVRLGRVRVAPYPATPRTGRWRLSWLRQRGRPMDVVMRSHDKEPLRRFNMWAEGPYDAVWFHTAAMFAWLGEPNLGPTVVDLVDLEDVKARQSYALRKSQRRPSSIGQRLQMLGAAIQARKNVRDWSRYQAEVARRVDRIVVASQADLQRCALPNAVVIPNTYPDPGHPLGRLQVGTPPSLLMQGRLDYWPNLDAARWLTDEIAPRLWSRLPSAEIRLVGATVPPAQPLHRPPGVTVVGKVPEIAAELARADLAVAPLRGGSGTRLKIVESFAHRIPVVATGLGADGLDARDGVHLLVADDADSFASHCHRLLTDLDLRLRLTDAAHRLFRENYERSVALTGVRQVVRGVMRSE